MCAHGPLTGREEVTYKWLSENKALKSVVLDKQLLNELLFLHKFEYSSNIEGIPWPCYVNIVLRDSRFRMKACMLAHNTLCLNITMVVFTENNLLLKVTNYETKANKPKLLGNDYTRKLWTRNYKVISRKSEEK